MSAVSSLTEDALVYFSLLKKPLGSAEVRNAPLPSAFSLAPAPSAWVQRVSP